MGLRACEWQGMALSPDLRLCMSCACTLGLEGGVRRLFVPPHHLRILWRNIDTFWNYS